MERSNGHDDWPPPAHEILILTGSIVASARALDEAGDAQPALLVRAGARYPRSLRELDHDATYLLSLDRTAGLLIGLLGAGNQAFGKDVLQAEMAAQLDIDPGTRDATVSAVDVALDSLRNDERG